MMMILRTSWSTGWSIFNSKNRPFKHNFNFTKRQPRLDFKVWRISYIINTTCSVFHINASLQIRDFVVMVLRHNEGVVFFPLCTFFFLLSLFYLVYFWDCFPSFVVFVHVFGFYVLSVFSFWDCFPFRLPFLFSRLLNMCGCFFFLRFLPCMFYSLFFSLYVCLVFF